MYVLTFSKPSRTSAARSRSMESILPPTFTPRMRAMKEVADVFLAMAVLDLKCGAIPAHQVPAKRLASLDPLQRQEKYGHQNRPEEKAQPQQPPRFSEVIHQDEIAG